MSKSVAQMMSRVPIQDRLKLVERGSKKVPRLSNGMFEKGSESRLFVTMTNLDLLI